MVIRPKQLGLSLTVLAVSVLAGCQERAEGVRLESSYDQATGKLSQLTYDSNSNGKSDSVSYMDGSRVLRVELDKNEDGLTDRWEYYRPDRSLEKVGISRSNDGNVDAWIFESSNGSVSRVEISTRRDGKVSRTEI